MDSDYKSKNRLCSRRIDYSSLRVKQRLGYILHHKKTDRIFQCAEPMACLSKVCTSCKIRKAMVENKMEMFKNTLLLT